MNKPFHIHWEFTIIVYAITNSIVSFYFFIYIKKKGSGSGLALIFSKSKYYLFKNFYR